MRPGQCWRRVGRYNQTLAITGAAAEEGTDNIIITGHIVARHAAWGEWAVMWPA